MNKEDKLMKWLIIIGKIVAILVAFTSIDGYLSEKQRLHEIEIQELLDLAEFYYNEGDYEGMAKVYSDELLQDNPRVLLNTGVMYVNGIYYMPEREEAIRYFELALENGETQYALPYLMQLLSRDDIDQIKELLKLGCEKNNKYCEKFLQDLYAENGLKCAGGYLYDFSHRTEEEQDEMIDKIFVMVGEHTYEVANEYNYIVYDDGTVKAEVTDTETQKIDKFIRKYFGKSEIKMVFD